MRLTAPQCSLEEVSAALGVTRQRAWQIEREAIIKCRRYFARRGITTIDLETEQITLDHYTISTEASDVDSNTRSA